MHTQNTLPLVELTAQEMIETSGGDAGWLSELIRHAMGGGQPIEIIPIMY